MATSDIPPAPKPLINIDTGGARPPLKKDKPAQAPTDSFAQLKSYSDAIMVRYDEVSKLFEGKPVAPTKNPEFKKFVEDTVAEVTMRYVVFGTFDKPGQQTEDQPTTTEEKLKASGFAVSGEQMKGLDPALVNSPAALLALSEGANLTGDDD
jgi:hypothetical protein